MSNYTHAVLIWNTIETIFCKRPYIEGMKLSSYKNEITCLDCLYELKNSKYEDDDYFAKRYREEIYKKEFGNLINE